MDRDSSQRIAAILNAAWLVRHYGLQRNASQRLRRTQAIIRLGLEIREAFSSSEDFEPLLAAIVDGLRPKESQPF